MNGRRPQAGAGQSQARAAFSRRTLLALIPFVLTACPSTPPVAYSLTTVLPSPVTPGETVTAFGVLPSSVTVSLDGSSLTSTPVPDGVSFTVPLTAVAGDLNLTVSGDGSSLAGIVSVKPKLSSVTISGETLLLSGSGWPTSSSNTTSNPTGSSTPNTTVLVNGLSLTPSVSSSGLSLPVPSALGYGALQVSVTVGDRSSDPVTVTRQAGTITGIVNLPASAPPPPAPAISSLSRLSSNTAPTTSSSVIVQTADPTVILPALDGLLEQSSLPSLGVTRLHFSSHDLAQSGLSRLSSWPGVSSLTFEGIVHPTDGFKSIPAPAPVRSSLAIQTASGPSGSTPSGPTQPGAGQWFLGLESIPSAWSQSRGEGVVIAVVDTGVNLNHPDLQANLLPGYDFVDDDITPQDIAGHGTHVAGLIAANGLATGVAPLAKLLPVRVLRDESGGSAFAVAQGILWSAGLLSSPPNPNPAQVINLSLGSDQYDPTIAAAVAQVLARGVIVVAAAGNSGGALSYPAALPGVIAVTALAGPTIPYQPWYASRGAGLWVTAYGGDIAQDQDANGAMDGILSTDLTPSGYGLRMGTSMASPQVAGLVALAISSGMPSSLVKTGLAATASDLGPLGFDARYGYGLISGRIGSPSSPKVYVLALDSSTLNTSSPTVLAWTPVQRDGTFSLTNLPAPSSVTLVAASDANGDGVLGHAGEFTSSSPVSVKARSGQTAVAPPFNLVLSGGSTTYHLEAHP